MQKLPLAGRPANAVMPAGLLISDDADPRPPAGTGAWLAGLLTVAWIHQVQVSTDEVRGRAGLDVGA